MEKEMATHSSILAWRILCTKEPGGLLSIRSHRVRHNWSNLACMHALEKEMATHSSVLVWRIPGTGEPGGLQSMGSHRVGHDWSDLGAAAARSLMLPSQWTTPKVLVSSSKPVFTLRLHTKYSGTVDPVRDANCLVVHTVCWTQGRQGMN